MNTPRFKEIKNINPISSNKKEINNNNLNNDEQINKFHFIKKKSIDSVFTLSSKKKEG